MKKIIGNIVFAKGTKKPKPKPADTDTDEPPVDHPKKPKP